MRQPAWAAAAADGQPHRLHGTPAQLFDHPPAFPGYRWSYNGHPVGEQVVATGAGPAHCDWQAVTFLAIGWPPGTSSATAAHSRQYVRDATGALPAATRYLRSTLDLHATLPIDAKPTGLAYRGVQIYVSAEDADRAIYVAGGGSVERWPRSDPMTLCA